MKPVGFPETTRGGNVVHANMLMTPWEIWDVGSPGMCVFLWFAQTTPWMETFIPPPPGR